MSPYVLLASRRRLGEPILQTTLSVWLLSKPIQKHKGDCRSQPRHVTKSLAVLSAVPPLAIGFPSACSRIAKLAAKNWGLCLVWHSQHHPTWDRLFLDPPPGNSAGALGAQRGGGQQARPDQIGEETSHGLHTDQFDFGFPELSTVPFICSY